MRIIETKAYQFQELDEQTKEKAIDNYRHISVEDNFWYEFIKEDLISVGIELRSFDLNRGSFAEIHIEDFYDTCKKIIDSHGVLCKTYIIAIRYIKEYNSIKNEMDVIQVYKDLEFNENDDSDEENLNKLTQYDEDLNDLDKEYQKEFSWEVLSMLRREYEYMTSDEYIIEMFQANEYEFTDQGKLI